MNGHANVTGDLAKLEANKKVVAAFIQAVINEKDSAAVFRFFGDRFAQHNPSMADGIEAFAAFVDHLRTRFPNLRVEVKRMIAENDLVMAHSHGVREPGQLGSAIIDIYRLEGGKIVEHWDVMEPVPETAKNTNGMF
jgi:predicted SnoaL-like aldol condensation-catalyzing enzyme